VLPHNEEYFSTDLLQERQLEFLFNEVKKERHEADHAHSRSSFFHAGIISTTFEFAPEKLDV
jgi:hypothetical protein